MRTAKTIIDNQINPFLKTLCFRFFKEGYEMHLDEHPCFNEGEEFLHGSLINTIIHTLVAMDKTSKDYKIIKKNLTKAIDISLNEVLNTFGILSFIRGILTLKKHGLYDEVISTDIEDILKKKLHWNVFMREDSLDFRHQRASNYYGVAFRIAMYRESLGWDDKANSQVFLERLYAKLTINSEATLYMDENFEGYGRYDKYTFTVAAELMEPYI